MGIAADELRDGDRVVAAIAAEFLRRPARAEIAPQQFINRRTGVLEEVIVENYRAQRPMVARYRGGRCLLMRWAGSPRAVIVCPRAVSRRASSLQSLFRERLPCCFCAFSSGLFFAPWLLCASRLFRQSPTTTGTASSSASPTSCSSAGRRCQTPGARPSPLCSTVRREARRRSPVFCGHRLARRRFVR